MAPGNKKYRKSNLVMVGILCGSVLAAGVMEVLVRVLRSSSPSSNHCNNYGNSSNGNGNNDNAVVVEDGAARREARQRGFEGFLVFGKK